MDIANNKCALRGFASQFLKEFLSIVSRPFKLIFLPLILAAVIGISTAFFDVKFIRQDIFCGLLTVIAVAAFLPLYAVRTLSAERVQGRHFAALEYNHRRGVIILGQFTADMLFALMTAFCGFIMHIITVSLTSGLIYSPQELLGNAFIQAAAVSLVCAVNICVSCYSVRRWMCYVFEAATVALFTGTALVFGLSAQIVVANWLWSALLIPACALLLGVAYLSYRVRGRLVR